MGNSTSEAETESPFSPKTTESLAYLADYLVKKKGNSFLHPPTPTCLPPPSLRSPLGFRFQLRPWLREPQWQLLNNLGRLVGNKENSPTSCFPPPFSRAKCFATLFIGKLCDCVMRGGGIYMIVDNSSFFLSLKWKEISKKEAGPPCQQLPGPWGFVVIQKMSLNSTCSVKIADIAREKILPENEKKRLLPSPLLRKYIYGGRRGKRLFIRKSYLAIWYMVPNLYEESS